MTNENPIQIYRKGPSAETAIHERLGKVVNAIDSLETRDGYVDMKKLLIMLREEYGYVYSKQTLYRDITTINSDNTFVLDLATHNYSEKMENLFNILEHVIKRASEIDQQKWTNSRIIRKKIATDQGETVIDETITTEELAGPHVKALDIMSKACKIMFDAFQGDVIDTGMALMLKEFQKIKAEKERLEEMVRRNENCQKTAGVTGISDPDIFRKTRPA